MTRKTETVAHLDASIARWKTRLKRSVTMIDKLEKKRKRLAKATEYREFLGVTKPVEKVVVFEPEPMVKVTSHPVANPDNVKLTFEPVAQVSVPAYPTVDSETTLGALPPSPKPTTNLDIPEFLRRGVAAQKAVDAVVADQIKAEQAEVKKKKAQGRIAKMKAKKSGETKKMPLSGKAALDAIRNG